MPQFNLITWNIQSGRGCDGRIDLRRIVDTARACRRRIRLRGHIP